MQVIETRTRFAGSIAAGIGSVAGVIGSFLVVEAVHGRAGSAWLQAVILLGGWFVVSLAAGLAAWMATQVFFRHALATGFTAFVLAGFLVYPATVLNQLLGVPPEMLALAGGLAAGVAAHWMVTRVDLA